MKKEERKKQKIEKDQKTKKTQNISINTMDAKSMTEKRNKMQTSTKAELKKNQPNSTNVSQQITVENKINEDPSPTQAINSEQYRYFAHLQLVLESCMTYEDMKNI